MTSDECRQMSGRRLSRGSAAPSPLELSSPPLSVCLSVRRPSSPLAPFPALSIQACFALLCSALLLPRTRIRTRTRTVRPSAVRGAMSAAGASPSGPGPASASAPPPPVNEKSESRGFFSKLFGRSSKRDSKTPTAASASAAPAAAVAQEAIDAQIVTRARHAHAAGAATAAHMPVWREWRFPPSLAGDKLEGAWRAWSAPPHAAATATATAAATAAAATGAAPASPPASGVPVSSASSSSAASGRSHSAAETRALLSCLEEVARDWETERRRGSSAASASARMHAAAAAAGAAAARDPLSSLPLLRLPFHSAHGHPSSLMRRVAQDFSHHVSHTLPDELAAFIAAHQQSQTQPQPPPSVSSSSTQVDVPGSPSPSVDQQLEHAPMFVMLQLVEHLILFTNNRLILQQSVPLQP